MSPGELDNDLARVRRMVPKPLRQVMLRVPDALDGVAEFVTETGLDRRVVNALRGLRGPTQEYGA
jgi:hypothetical protein